MAKFCTNCGTSIADDAKFCIGCGSQQGAAPPLNTAPPQAPEPVPQYTRPAPAYQPQYQQTAPAAQPKQKKRLSTGLKVLIIIAAAIVVIIIAAIIAVPFIARSALSSEAQLDYYEIGGDLIPSVKLALGETRELTGVHTNVTNGVSTKQYIYKIVPAQNMEMEEYAYFLHDYDGFRFTTDADFNRIEAAGIQLMREAQEDGYVLVAQIDYGASGFTISIMRGRGTIEPIEDATTTSNPNVSGPDKENYYLVGSDEVPSLLLATGLERDHSVIAMNDGLKVIAQYDAAADSAPGTDVAAYDDYLTNQAGFIRVSDTNFSQPEGRVEIAKESAYQDGLVVLVTAEWDAAGYTITVELLEGTLTAD